MSTLSDRRPTLVRYLRCPELMDRMMERVGVAADEAACVDGGLAWLEASTKCTFCRNVGTCCRWFENSETDATPENFCPNIKFFDTSAEYGSAASHATADANLMPWRLQQLGLDPGYVKVCRPSTYQNLESVCASCKSRPQCARDLARGDVEAGMRSYCPNAPTIDALVVNWDP